MAKKEFSIQEENMFMDIENETLSVWRKKLIKGKTRYRHDEWGHSVYKRYIDAHCSKKDMTYESFRKLYKSWCRGGYGDDWFVDEYD